MDRWIGKVAVVTGASSGIGAEIALHLANMGLKVVGLARRKQLIDQLAQKVTGKGKIYSLKVDLSKQADIKAAFEWIDSELGGPYILINNAAYVSPGSITDYGDQKVNDDAIAMAVDVNLKGLILCTRLAVSSMRKRNVEGHIVNMNSVTGHYIPAFQTTNVYPPTKHGLTAFSVALIRELAKYKSKIKVTNLSPGVVATAMLPPELANAPQMEANDVVDALIYVLSTPPSINIYELGIKSIGEGLL